MIVALFVEFVRNMTKSHVCAEELGDYSCYSMKEEHGVLMLNRGHKQAHFGRIYCKYA